MDDLPTWADFAMGWEAGFYRDAVVTAAVAGLSLGYLGVFIVVRRMVFITAAISQASGLGVAASFYAGIHLGLAIDPLVGATVSALLWMLVVSIDPERLRLPREALLGFAFLSCWALMILVSERITQEAHDVAEILFGTAVLVPEELRDLVLGVSLLVVIVHGIGYRGFVFVAFDAESAKVQGLPVRLLEFASWTVVTLAVAVCTRALGVLPVFAFAVLPGMSALLIVRRLRWALLIASVMGGLSGALGYLLAFFCESTVGASQAAVAVGFFLVALLVRGGRRVVATTG